MSDTVNESSAYQLTMNHTGFDGKAEIPSNARYRLDDKDSLAEIIAWTDVTELASEMVVDIPAAANDIIDTSKSTERKVFTFSTDYDTTEEHNAQLIYAVVNLAFAQVP